MTDTQYLGFGVAPFGEAAFGDAPYAYELYRGNGFGDRPFGLGCFGDVFRSVEPAPDPLLSGPFTGQFGQDAFGYGPFGGADIRLFRDARIPSRIRYIDWLDQFTPDDPPGYGGFERMERSDLGHALSDAPFMFRVDVAADGRSAEITVLLRRRRGLLEELATLDWQMADESPLAFGDQLTVRCMDIAQGVNACLAHGRPDWIKDL